MLWQRLLFGALMIAALCGLLLLDGWISERGSHISTPPNVFQLDGAQPTRAVEVGAEAAGEERVKTDLAFRLGRGLPVTLLVLLLAVLATYELGRLCNVGAYRPLTHWAAFVAAGLVFLPWVEMQSGGAGSATALHTLTRVNLSLPVLWITGGMLGTCLGILARQKTAQATGDMAITLFLFLYTGLLGSFAVRIRCEWPNAAGAAILAYFVLSVKAGDIGAYFTGLLIGRHKLVPWLSPKKTVEGLMGALVYGVGVAVGGMILWPRLGLPIGPPPLSLSQAVVFGLVMALAGHLGDFVESAIKRDVGSKDSASVVPAFGGLLDILDSPLFTAPIAWWLLTLWGPSR
jgi:phosphatidate cytidylyltransferase